MSLVPLWHCHRDGHIRLGVLSTTLAPWHAQAHWQDVTVSESEADAASAARTEKKLSVRDCGDKGALCPTTLKVTGNNYNTTTNRRRGGSCYSTRPPWLRLWLLQAAAPPLCLPAIDACGTCCPYTFISGCSANERPKCASASILCASAM